jgi:nucleoside-diphosphate-sugar epimerase
MMMDTQTGSEDMSVHANGKVALVAGAGGIIGNAVAHELKRQGWTVRALARRSVEGFESIAADLTDAEAIGCALSKASDVTHVFYAALSPDSDLSVEADRNGRMLGNLLDALETSGAALERVVIYQGFKIYGVHLGAQARTPARESDPPHMPPNIYLAQEAQLRSRAQRSRWDYVALRPDAVVGAIHGNPMNIALVVGVFAEISRALGIPLRFPGTDKAYTQLVQFTDAGLLARASAWAATCKEAGGEAFNVTNGDVFRWERMWEDVAEHLGINIASPVPLTLTRHMADKGPIWREIAKKHDLLEADVTKLVGWGFGDFIFHTEVDVISDVNKIYRFGFTERMDSSASLIEALDQLKEKRILP